MIYNEVELDHDTIFSILGAISSSIHNNSTVTGICFYQSGLNIVEIVDQYEFLSKALDYFISIEYYETCSLIKTYMSNLKTKPRIHSDPMEVSVKFELA